MFGLGAGEILVIAIVALIFIGPKKLPELAKNLGKGLREFQKAKDELMSQVNEVDPKEKVQWDPPENITGVASQTTGPMPSTDSEKTNKNEELDLDDPAPTQSEDSEQNSKKKTS